MPLNSALSTNPHRSSAKTFTNPQHWYWHWVLFKWPPQFLVAYVYVQPTVQALRLHLCHHDCATGFKITNFTSRVGNWELAAKWMIRLENQIKNHLTTELPLILTDLLQQHRLLWWPCLESQSCSQWHLNVDRVFLMHAVAASFVALERCLPRSEAS